MMQIVPWVETPWELQKFYCHQGRCDFHSKYWRKEFWETVDSTDFICVSTSSQELCCWILDAFIEIILYHQRNGDLAWGWVPKFQGSSQETNFIHGCLAVHAVNHETIQSVRSWIIMDHCIECVPGLIMYTCSDTDRRVVQLRTWAPPHSKRTMEFIEDIEACRRNMRQSTVMKFTESPSHSYGDCQDNTMVWQAKTFNESFFLSIFS